MIDSNETLTYQAGRESGYDNGYCDGVVEFAEYLRMESFLCDSNDWHSFNAIDVDDLNDFVKEFLETR